jgi:hypothetical protein
MEGSKLPKRKTDDEGDRAMTTVADDSIRRMDRNQQSARPVLGVAGDLEHKLDELDWHESGCGLVAASLGD